MYSDQQMNIKPKCRQLILCINKEMTYSWNTYQLKLVIVKNIIKLRTRL